MINQTPKFSNLEPLDKAEQARTVRQNIFKIYMRIWIKYVLKTSSYKLSWILGSKTDFIARDLSRKRYKQLIGRLPHAPRHLYDELKNGDTKPIAVMLDKLAKRVRHNRVPNDLLRYLEAVIYARGTNMREVCFHLGYKSNEIKALFKNKGKQPIEKALKKVCYVINSSYRPFSELIDLLPLIDRTHDIEVERGKRKWDSRRKFNRKNIHVFLHIYNKSHHTSARQVSLKHGEFPSRENMLIVKGNKYLISRQLHELNPQVAEKTFQELAYGNQQPIERLMKSLHDNVHDHASFNMFVRCLLYRHGTNATRISQELGHGEGYFHNCLSASNTTLKNFCTQMAQYLHIKTSYLVNPIYKFKSKRDFEPSTSSTINWTNHALKLQATYLTKRLIYKHHRLITAVSNKIYHHPRKLEYSLNSNFIRVNKAMSKVMVLLNDHPKDIVQLQQVIKSVNYGRHISNQPNLTVVKAPSVRAPRNEKQYVRVTHKNGVVSFVPIELYRKLNPKKD